MDDDFTLIGCPIKVFGDGFTRAVEPVELRPVICASGQCRGKGRREVMPWNRGGGTWLDFG